MSNLHPIFQAAFPYFLYPAISISMTASVFMTVGIALERYIAVHYPIDYSQVSEDNTIYYAQKM